MTLQERNRSHIKNFLRYFSERVYSEKLRALASQTARSRGKYIQMGQADFWDSPGDRMKLLNGVLI